MCIKYFENKDIDDKFMKNFYLKTTNLCDLRFLIKEFKQDNLPNKSRKYIYK